MKPTGVGISQCRHSVAFVCLFVCLSLYGRVFGNSSKERAFFSFFGRNQHFVYTGFFFKILIKNVFDELFVPRDDKLGKNFRARVFNTCISNIKHT